MMMSMYITWGVDCQFIFYAWHTKALSSFAMALVLTFIYSFLTVGYSKMVSLAKDTLFLRGSNPVKLRAFVALTFAVGLVVKYSIMFLIMTMNGWVNLVLALGMMSGYVAFMLKRDQAIIYASLGQSRGAAFKNSSLELIPAEEEVMGARSGR